MNLATEIKKRDRFDSLAQEVFLNLQRTADRLARDLEPLFKPANLSATQYNVLRILRGAGEAGLACGEIACRMITADSDMTRLLDRLETRGLITRARQPSDRRVVITTITKKALALLAKLDEPLTNAHREQLSHMSDRQLRDLLKLLEVARSQINRKE
jgi:DNA-binding MarR family transcriptional regulator